LASVVTCGGGQGLADALAGHPGLAGALVLARRQFHDQLAAQPGADVLDLAHDPVALGVDVELGDLAAGVAHLERVRTGGKLRTAQLAAVLRCGDRDRATGGVLVAGVGGAAAREGTAGEHRAGREEGGGT
jgi:hypothetical protein